MYPANFVASALPALRNRFFSQEPDRAFSLYRRNESSKASRTLSMGMKP